MNDLIGKAPELIREAAKSTLGLLALCVVAVSIVALAFFTTASEITKVLIFAFFFVGIGLFVVRVLQLAKMERSKDITIPSTPLISSTPSVSSTPTNYGTRPYPQDILDALDKLPPFQQLTVQESYIGLKVRWRLIFCDVILREGDEVTLTLNDHNNNVNVVCSVCISDYPRLKIIDKGTSLWVSGTVYKIYLHVVHLSNSVIAFDQD